MTAKVKKVKAKGNYKPPEYKDIAKAVGYWVVLDDLCKFFKDANMPKVSKHLSGACKEIDLIWSEFETRNTK